MNRRTIKLKIMRDGKTYRLVVGMGAALALIPYLSGCSLDANGNTIIENENVMSSALSQSELLTLINQGKEIEIEIAVPEGATLPTQESLEWIILAALATNPDLRAQWDDILKITKDQTGKYGCLYVSVEGIQDNNNTLRVALHNRAFLSMLEDSTTMDNLATAGQNQYVDIDVEDSEKAFNMALNSYFNLLPEADINEANADAVLTRAEFMTMVARAELPVDDNLRADSEFEVTVGESKFNKYASQVAKNSYLDIETKSLNNKTYNGIMSRGEAVYMLVSRYFADELAKVGNMSANFNDCKDGGDIAKAQKFIEDITEKDYCRDYELVYAIQNPDNGAPTKIYNAMVVAQNKNLIGEDTRWDEGITKNEAIDLLIKALKTETGIKTFNFDRGLSNLATNTEAPKAETEETEETSGANIDGAELPNDGIVVSDEEAAFIAAAEEEAFKEAEEAGEVITEEVKIEESLADFHITAVTKTMYATAQANVRKGPNSKQYSVITTVNRGTALSVIGQADNGWYQLQLADGQIGFISNTLVSDTKPQPQAPQASTAPQAAPSGGLRDSTGKTLSDRMRTFDCDAGYEITGTLRIEGLQ